MSARIDKQMQVQIGFVERLVMFWSNHFSMTVNKVEAVRGTFGQWERDVIRKNVLGKFHDMLRETYNHPAMIAYLDNDNSIGPNSQRGIEWGVGLNENLARELMELHTVGSGGGYTEADVTAMAKILTGWSYVRGWEADNRFEGGTPQNRGQFIYRPRWHEPGAITLMGKRYAPAGKDQCEAVLLDLARSPGTAEHIAFKLVHHFITDEPTPAMVDPIKQAFLDSDGDLKAVALALINLPEAWSLPFEKIRTPYEMTIAQYRALSERYSLDDGWMLTEPLYALRQMPWKRPRRRAIRMTRSPGSTPMRCGCASTWRSSPVGRTSGSTPATSSCLRESCSIARSRPKHPIELTPRKRRASTIPKTTP